MTCCYFHPGFTHDTLGAECNEMGRPTIPSRAMATLNAHRRTLVQYAKDRIEDEDWHGLSDAANYLRELDVEIRMTK